MDMDARQENDAALDRPLPTGETLYARRWTGIRESERPGRKLNSRRAACGSPFAGYMPQRSAAV
jgi:hypothetical protein